MRGRQSAGGSEAASQSALKLTRTGGRTGEGELASPGRLDVRLDQGSKSPTFLLSRGAALLSNYWK